MLLLFTAAGVSLQGASDDLEQAIAILRHVKIDAYSPVEKRQKYQEINDAWSVIAQHGQGGVDRTKQEVDLIWKKGERDDFFLLGAGALLWRLRQLDEADYIARIWSKTSLRVQYEYVLFPAHQLESKVVV